MENLEISSSESDEDNDENEEKNKEHVPINDSINTNKLLLTITNVLLSSVLSKNKAA